MVRTLIPKDGGFDLQHLRRFAKPEAVPEYVKRNYDNLGDPAIDPSSNPSPEEENENNERVEEKKIFLIVAATSIIDHTSLVPSLETILGPGAVKLSTTNIPLLAPTSAEQAAQWSAKYWPTVYKKSNPFGPHVSIVSRAQEEIATDVGRWMDMAWRLADEAREKRVGEGVGCVIVERRVGEAKVVVAAGDGRWCCWNREGGGEGNVTAHAVMRGIGMVSEGLARDHTTSPSLPSPPASTSTQRIFRNQPILELEQTLPEKEIDIGGYLCHELEIYCTHEPCVMCSMAIVHSRFRKAVFEKRMVRTGGLCADEEGLGHGLWWRKELNWTMLAWQWVRPEGFREGFDDGGNEGLNT